MLNRDKAVVILSGGLDSSTLLAFACHIHPEVRAITFDYGQRHGHREISAAIAIANYYRPKVIDHKVVDMLFLKDLTDSSLTGHGEIPEGHYADANMRSTVVANRNLIMASIAASWAISTDSAHLYIGVHAGDHTVYPDCRPEFINAMEKAFWAGNYPEEQLNVCAPFLTLTKDTIVRKGMDLKVPYNLTWSCYKGEEYPCGKCGTCVERLEAFHLNHLSDPLLYSTEEIRQLNRRAGEQP